MPEIISQPARSRRQLTTSTESYVETLVRQFCLNADLSTYDPYDVWKTRLGFGIKKLYNRHTALGALPASLFYGLDLLNHERRLFYRKTDYPIVRAFAILCLLDLYRRKPEEALIESALVHARWLLARSCYGYKGLCWGLGFRHAVSRHINYDANTPFSTITPYVLEALLALSQFSEVVDIESVVEGVFRFFDCDLAIMYQDSEALATSYGPLQDRTVINAVSYAMYSYALCLPFLTGTQRLHAENRIRQLYAFIRRHQQPNGSWFYSIDPSSFIDCFHSCIILKNIIKTTDILILSGSNALVASGYRYIYDSLFDRSTYLFKRFSVRNKPTLICFDLYDNAEALNLAVLLNENESDRLLSSIVRHFCRDLNVYSQIDIFGILRNRNTLRWAVLPFLFAGSEYLLKSSCTNASTKRC
jgi:hypothetical protein